MIRRLVRRALSFVVAMASVSAGSSTHASTADTEPRRLGPEASTIQGSLVGEGHGVAGDLYVVTLAVGDALIVEVEQLGVDLHVELIDPTGRFLLDVDSHTGNWSIERLIAVAETAGDHRLKVVPFEGELGDYRLSHRAIGPANGSARSSAAAMALVFDLESSRRVEQLQDALALFSDAGDPHGMADVYDRLGRASDPRSAAAHDAFFRATHLFMSLGDSRRAGLVRMQQALVRQRVGDVEAARSLLEQATRELEGDPIEQMEAYNALGIAKRRLGEAQGAVDAYDAALALARAQGRDTSAIRHNLAVAWQQVGDLRRALRLFEEVLDDPDATRWRAATLDKVGQIHARLGDDEAAIEALDRAYALRLRHDDARGIAVTLSSYALAHREAGRWDEAEAAYRRCLRRLETVDEPQTRAVTLAQLARLETRRGALAEAEPRLREALAIYHRLGDAQGEAGVGLDLALWHWASGDLDAAVDAVEAALGRVDALRSSLRGVGLLDADSIRRDARYHEAVDLVMALEQARPGEGWVAKALEISERGRARSARRLLESATTDLVETSDGTLRLEVSVPETALDVLDAASIRALLAVDEVALEFDLGAERSWLFWIDRTSIRAYPLPPAAEIEARARAAHALLANSQRRETRASLDKALSALSEMLLAPIADSLDERRLIVVPDGALHLVPFGLLTPLGDRPVSRTLSMSTLGSLRRRAATRNVEADRWTIVGAPRTVGLPPLSHARREIETIAAIGARTVGADQVDAFVDTAADWEALDSPSATASRVVHLATHAMIDPECGDCSWLALSQVDEDGDLVDGTLAVADLVHLELNAELVTLSACRSALGRAVRGEGWVGLVRAFFHAGARRVVASLWDVDDAASTVWMEAFYRHLSGSGDPAQAVRHAGLTVRADPRHAAPYYWAGFVLIGDPRPIDDWSAGR